VSLLKTTLYGCAHEINQTTSQEFQVIPIKSLHCVCNDHSQQLCKKIITDQIDDF